MLSRSACGQPVIDAAKAFRVDPPTLVAVVQDLVRKGWVLNKRSTKDRRVVCLKLSRKGEVLLERVAPIVQRVETMLNNQKRSGMTTLSVAQDRTR